MDWRKALLRNLGYKPTNPNLRFLDTWQRWEGGHTNNDARFNWLNTTKDAPGAIGSINSVGVKKFNSFQNGIRATAATLRNGRYKDILGALSSGNPYKFNPSAGLQTWVSGSPTGNPAYAQKILGGRATVALAHTAAPHERPPRNNSWDYAMSLVFEDDPEMISLMQSLNPHDLDKQMQTRGIVDPGGSLQPVPVGGQHDLSTVLEAAQSQLGKPYVFGSGPSTASFDCSDLVQWAYGQIGVRLPRTTFEQIHAGRSVKWNDLQPGDLIFPTGHHVVMYVGHGKVIAAPHTGEVVQYQPVTDFSNPVAIRRVLK